MTKQVGSRFNDWGPGALDFGPPQPPADVLVTIPNAEEIDAELERRVEIREAELLPAADRLRRKQ